MLEETTTEFIFHFMLIFARFGVAFSTFPALGDKSILMRARVIFAVVVSFVLYPELWVTCLNILKTLVLILAF